MDDVKAAVASGVDRGDLCMATSGILRKHSHGKGIDAIIDIAREVVAYCKQHNIEVRFSCEDSFRSKTEDLLKIYKAMDGLGVNRVGIADTVGVATPFQVFNIARQVREAVNCDIEFHTHDDTGCCIANARIAIQAGATHIDTCILGIGERNGITPLGGFLARMYTINKKRSRARYNLPLIRDLEKFIATKSDIVIPFNNYVTGTAAFSHKAGVHSKAVISNPGSYEVLDPNDFGVERVINIAHRLTGWHAIKQRAIQLGFRDLPDEKVKELTAHVKHKVSSLTFSSGKSRNPS
jgi:homocitrate synthase